MARSKEALERRALKRGRTLQEQQLADANKERPPSKKQRQIEDALAAPGAWKCPACGTENFASRYICKSTTCVEPKPASAKQSQAAHHESKANDPNTKSNKNEIEKDLESSEQKKVGKKRKQQDEKSNSEKKEPKIKRHDPKTSKSIIWESPQATPSQIQYNHQLRERYAAKDPTLTGEELERAKILVQRDERKKQKKANRKNSFSKKKETEFICANKSSAPDSSAKKKNRTENSNSNKSSADQKKANKSLLERYNQTQGKDMSEAEVCRAKVLIARKERRQQIQKDAELKESDAKITTESKNNGEKEDKAMHDKQSKTNGEVGMTTEAIIAEAKMLIAAKQEKKAKKKKKTKS